MLTQTLNLESVQHEFDAKIARIKRRVVWGHRLCGHGSPGGVPGTAEAIAEKQLDVAGAQ